MASERELVLGIPKLAARLTKQPLGYAKPEQWNGYIPPYMVPAGDHHRRNDSPQRVHLVAIVRQAMAQTYGEPVAEKWLAEINTDRWTSTWMPSAEEAMHRASRVLQDASPKY